MVEEEAVATEVFVLGQKNLVVAGLHRRHRLVWPSARQKEYYYYCCSVGDPIKGRRRGDIAGADYVAGTAKRAARRKKRRREHFAQIMQQHCYRPLVVVERLALPDVLTVVGADLLRLLLRGRPLEPRPLPILLLRLPPLP